MNKHDRKAEQLIKQGDELLERGDLTGAEEMYKRALVKNPRSAEALYSMGCVWSHRRDFVSSAEWGRKALSVDPGHGASHALLGNALFGQEHYEEAIEEFRAARGDLRILAQIGLCLEKLEKLDEAEATLRSVLEHDTAYMSRGLPLALFQYSVFFADVHHALARVLQREGHREEAWLHYHLAKRHDPQIELDPMFRDIITDADLEDHPYYDRQAEQRPLEQAELPDKLVFLAKLTDYETLETEAETYRLKEALPRISALIAELQRQGSFFLSARLRIIGDIVDGKDARSIFRGIATNEWQRAIELAEALHKGEVADEEAELLAGRIVFATEELLLLCRFSERFVALEPETGVALARVLEASGRESTNAGARAEVRRILGKAYFSLRNSSLAEEILARSAADYEHARDEGIVIDWAHALETFRMLSRAQTNQNRRDDALLTDERALRVAEASGAPEAVLFALYYRAQALAQLGRHQESLDEALLVAGLARQHGASEELRGNLIAILLRAAEALGIPAPSDEIASLSTPADPESVLGLCRQADEALEADQLPHAVILLEKARVLALDSHRYSLLVDVLRRLGTALHDSGRSKEALEILEEALLRSKSMPTETDAWAILFELARIAHEQGDQLAEISRLESALEEARREKNEERLAQTHEQLAMALINTDPQRAIEHMNYRMSHGSSKEDRPGLLSQAADAFQAGSYAEAQKAYESLIGAEEDVPPSERALALANLGTCLHYNGEPAAAIERWEVARDAFYALDDPSRAIEVGCRAANRRADLGMETDGPVQKLAEIWSSIENPGLRRSRGIEVAACAAETMQLALAEQIANECLKIATSSDWRDNAAEMETRKILGKVFRLTARYADALDQYECALRLATDLGDEPTAGTIHGWMAIACRYHGQLDAAVEHYIRAIEIAESYGDALAAAWHRFNYAGTLLSLGQRQKALSYFSQAFAEVSRAGNRVKGLRILTAIATNYTHEELPPDLALQATGLETDGLNCPDTVVRSYALSKRALRLLSSARVQEASDLLAQVIQIHEEAGDRYNQAAATLNRARLLYEHSPENAVTDACTAKTIADLIGHEWLAVKCDEFLLDVALKADNADVVKSFLDKLLPAQLKVRRGLRNDADRIHLADKIARQAECCAGLLLKHGDVRGAFEIQEYSRAQALSDLLASSTPRLDGEPFSEKAVPTETPHRVADLSEAKALLESFERQAVIITLGIAGEELVGMSLRKGEEEPRVHATGVTRKDLTKLVELFRHEMHALNGKGAITWPSAAARVLRFAEDSIHQDDLVLLFTAEELQPLPLQAVKLGDGQMLIERATVAYEPSLTVLAQLKSRGFKRSQSRRDFLSIGVAFPEEALAIQRRCTGLAFTGNNLSKEQIREALSDAGIVHFSCHGYFDQELYLESGLCLRNSASPLRADILSVRDLKLWRLDNDLITLSACESGLGKIAVSEFLGLTRSFLAAGSNSVVATLWRVNAKAALALMLSFYDRLDEQRRGDCEADIAEALRQAQLEFFRKGVPLRDWAGFKLVGSPTMRGYERTSSKS